MVTSAERSVVSGARWESGSPSWSNHKLQAR